MSQKIILTITDDQLDAWKKSADKKDVPLELFVEGCVEGELLRGQIIKYLNKQAKHLPWWKKKQYNL